MSSPSESEPSKQDIIEACRGTVANETLEFMQLFDDEDVLGAAISELHYVGVEDPDAFLREKGILE